MNFKSFKQVLNYRPKCLFCKCCLSINDINYIYNYEESLYEKILRFHLSKIDGDSLIFNLNTDQVELSLNKRRSDLLYDYTKQAYYTPPVPIYNGILINDITINCNVCYRYTFNIKFHFNLTERCLNKIIFNFETIYFGEGNTGYEIKNNYPLDITEYCSLNKNEKSEKISIPLIPIDLDNPEETLSRIRKLLIFS